MKYVIAILSIVIVCLLLSRCNDHRQWDKERSLYVLNDSLLQKKILNIRDSNNRQIIEYSVQSISTNQLLASQSTQIEQLKKDLKVANGKPVNIKSSTFIASVTKDTSSIKIDSVVYIHDTGIKEIPFFYQPDSFLIVQGITHLHIDSNSLTVKGLDLIYNIKNNSSVTYYTKSRFLHKQELNLLITQDNPHTTTGRVQTYYIHPEKKWFEKWYIHAGIGAISTLFLVNYLK